MGQNECRWTLSVRREGHRGRGREWPYTTGGGGVPLDPLPSRPKGPSCEKTKVTVGIGPFSVQRQHNTLGEYLGHTGAMRYFCGECSRLTAVGYPVTAIRQPPPAVTLQVLHCRPSLKGWSSMKNGGGGGNLAVKAPPWGIVGSKDALGVMGGGGDGHLKGCSAATSYCWCARHPSVHGGRLKRSARVVQLFGRLAVVETHTLWYFGHDCCLVVGFDAVGIWHFWIFTLFHPFPSFCTHFLLFSTTSTIF